MDREQILEDFREWVAGFLERGMQISPYDIFEELDRLEEEYA